jgi:uncharacterized phage protein gp47/JayE
MPWITPTLRQVRTMVRDDITSALSGAIIVGNSVLRVISDTNAGLAHLVLRYIDWLARQLLPDTAEVEWLDRHGDIWLVNADGTTGRKSATFAAGQVTMTGNYGVVVPSGMVLSGNVGYETTEQITLGVTATPVAVRATDGGVLGNMNQGDTINLLNAPAGIDSNTTVVVMEGGADQESDDLLRARVLFRIQNPPMGGDAADYVAWTTAVAGVTRAWSYPNEMGVGTITVRFMMDDLRSSNNGYPLQQDIDAVAAYLDRKRPVAIKDRFIMAPISFPYTVMITGLDNDTPAVRASILAAIKDMEYRRILPGQTLFRSWVDEAISGAVGENSHELIFTTIPMPSPGYIAQVGSVIYG